MNRETRQTGGTEHRVRLAIATAAIAGMAGALLTGKHLESAVPPEKPTQATAEGPAFMSYEQRLVRIKEAIQHMHDYGADDVWVENTTDKGTRKDTKLTQFMVAIPVSGKSNKTFDQIVLFVNHGQTVPERLMIVRGADEPKYRVDNQNWSSWVEIDKAGKDRYLGLGQLGEQSVNSFNIQENLSEIVVDSAEAMLGLPQADSNDPRLIA